MNAHEILQEAADQARRLAEAAGIRPIAMAIDQVGAGPVFLPCLLSHELVAGHAAMMRLMEKLDLYLNEIAVDRPPEQQDRACRQAVQLSTAAARLTERYRLGVATLARLEGWPANGGAAGKPPHAAATAAADPDDDPFDDGPGGGMRRPPDRVLAETRALNRSAEAALHAATANGSGSHAAAPARRGRLRHGNPSGDLLAAPRCGARTRAGCACRQPAMANGRCRLHGGKSTGARTAAGLARCRTATLVHGHRSAEIIELKSAAARSSRALHALTHAARANLRSERPTPPARRSLGEGGCPATADDSPRAVGATPCGRPSIRGTGGRPGWAASTALRSERPTPCPARRGAVSPRSHEGHEDAPAARPSCPSWLRGEFRPRRAA